MALLDTDVLAVWRDTEKKNYATTVAQIVDRVPNPAAPSLTAVLQTSNVSQNESIIIQTSGQTEVVKLSPTTASIFANGLTSSSTLNVGSGLRLTTTSALQGSACQLVGNTDNNAILIYPSGTTINDLTATPTATITNAGVATFAGALEAASIDGGVYAT